MESALKVIFSIILIVVVGTGIFLANWDIPAPISKVEKVIPNDRFPK